jgi:DnaK suppressor protein
MLDKKIIAEQQEKLLAKRKELYASLNLKSQSNDSDDEVKDPLDAAVTYTNRELVAREVEQYRALLQDVEDALGRIEDGSYGVCLGSGDDIPVKRLQAIPWARYTAAYQEKLEQGLVSE